MSGRRADGGDGLGGEDSWGHNVCDCLLYATATHSKVKQEMEEGEGRRGKRRGYVKNQVCISSRVCFTRHSPMASRRT